MRGYSNNQHGIALVVVLLALVLLTAMVVEFSYGVYTGTNDLYNWRDAQRLSVMARSGVHMSSMVLTELLKNPDTWPKEMPVENPFDDFKGSIIIRIEDENAKLNLNALINNQDQVNGNQYEMFKKLLSILSTDEKIADRIIDWMDSDSTHRLPELTDSEAGAKNAALDSVDELLLIHGISKEDYDKLLPYVTVYGNDKNVPLINVNSAQEPVLRSLYDPDKGFTIDENKAKSIVQYRNNNPFKDFSAFNEFAKTRFSANQITVQPELLTIRSTASSGGVKRVIETVLDTTTNKVQYWKEY